MRKLGLGVTAIWTRNAIVIILSNGFDKNARKECSKDFHKKKILVNYPHLKGVSSSFSDTACIKVSLNVEATSPEA